MEMKVKSILPRVIKYEKILVTAIIAISAVNLKNAGAQNLKMFFRGNLCKLIYTILSVC